MGNHCADLQAIAFKDGDFQGDPLQLHQPWNSAETDSRKIGRAGAACQSIPGPDAGDDRTSQQPKKTGHLDG